MASTSYIQNQLLKIQGNLLNFAYSLTSNRDDAYDLVQETTLKVLDSTDKYSEKSNFRGWVLTIMRNLFINEYRRTVRHGVVNDYSDEQYMINTVSEDRSDTPEDSYSVEEIVEVIKSLPAEYSEPFRLMVRGYQYQEIADTLGLPLGTVKSRIFFARKRLQNLLADYRK